MDTRAVLEKLKSGEISVDEAEGYLRRQPFEDMGFAKLDTHREIRSGFPEVVFCEGKPDIYLIKIFERLDKEGQPIFATRATERQFKILKAFVPGIKYDQISRIISSRKPEDTLEPEGQVTIVSGGTADIPVAEEAAQTAEYFGTKVERVYDVGVSGLHRLLSTLETVQNANCIIAVAGMEGALASVVGGLVKNPVIAVPTSVGYGASMNGLSALLTMINSCANGIAVVNIDNGYGAGYIATQINRLAINKGK